MLIRTPQSKSRHEWQRYVAFSFAASDLLLELDENLTVVFVAGASEELVGHPPDRLIGTNFVDLIDPLDDRSALATAIRLLSSGQRLPQRTITLARSRTQVTVSGFRLPEDEGRIYLAVSQLVIPTPERAKLNRDSETGLLQGDEFGRLVEDQVRLLNTSGQDAALSLFQVSEFGALRSHIGDAGMCDLLEEIGRLLRGYSVGGDSAGRLAEDKYGIVHSAGSIVSVLSDKIAQLIARADPTGGSGVEGTTLSLTEHGLNEREVAQAARYVMNRFVDHDLGELCIDSIESGFRQQMAATVVRIDSIKRIVAEDSIDLVFQPIVTLSDRTIHHYEALSRFSDGSSPFETITFAEQVGIIQDFDLAVAVKTLEFLKRNATTYPGLRIAVNLSPRSLESDGFVEALRSLMDEEPELRGDVLFELTESYKARDLERTGRITQTLRQDGHLVCLDDFGAGGASFDYLQAIHVDYVKLDGTYVRRMMDNCRDSYILAAMAGLCDKLEIETIAEFVETAEQAERLRALGVRLGQGWLFGKPEPNPIEVDLRPDRPNATPAARQPVRRRALQAAGA